MTEIELNALVEKFPCVLKKAQNAGLVDVRKYELISKFGEATLYRGIKRQKGMAASPLFNSDFASQAELAHHIEQEKKAIARSMKYNVPDDLKIQMDLFNNTQMYNNFDPKKLGEYSCSFSDSYEKLESLFAKPNKGRFIAKGIVKETDGLLSRTDGTPGHIHGFLFESANLKDSFEVLYDHP